MDEQIFRRSKRANRIAKTVIVGCGLIVASASCAQATVTDVATTPDAARGTFVLVTEEIATGALEKPTAAQLEILAGYPLFPYVEMTRLQREMIVRPGVENDREIRAWLEQYDDLALASHLRRSWLYRLARRQSWTKFLAEFRPTSSKTLNCHRARALIATGASNAKTVALERWNVGESQPDECDPVFAWLKTQGELTAARYQSRLDLAKAERSTSLVRYLNKKLPANQQGPGRTWLAWRTAPSVQVESVIRAKRLADWQHDYLVNAMTRIAVGDSVNADDVRKRLERAVSMPNSVRDRIRRGVALGLAYDRNDRALALFDTIPASRMTTPAHEWRVRNALYFGDWRRVAIAIDAMPADLQGEQAWRYWRGRAHDAAGERARARRLYLSIAGDRSYYGYLAADRVGARYAIDNKPAEIDVAARASLVITPAMARAREWWALDKPAEARDELSDVTRGADKDALVQIAKLLQAWEWHEQAIIVLARAQFWDDMTLRYPLPNQQQVNAMSLEFGVPPALILAITRSESLFARDARSGVGARGLMQLMPSTAKQVAREDGTDYSGADSLEEPDLNIRFGTRYLRDVLERFDGNIAMAAAAYNAGPHRVDRWRPDTVKDTAVWIENIPFNATRSYAMKVFKHMAGFDWALAGEDVSEIKPLSVRLGQVMPVNPDVPQRRVVQ